MRISGLPIVSAGLQDGSDVRKIIRRSVKNIIFIHVRHVNKKCVYQREKEKSASTVRNAAMILLNAADMDAQGGISI